MLYGWVGMLMVGLLLAACSDGGGGHAPAPADPGGEPWVPVAAERVAEECGLDPALLARADADLLALAEAWRDAAPGRELPELAWAAVRYGKLCHELYATGADAVDHVWSATKTLGAVATGVAAFQTRGLARSGRKTGPLSDEDRVDHWLDDFSFNPEARVAHVLAMVAHNPDLSVGAKAYRYDWIGDVQINRLSDIVNTAIAQDPERLGSNIEDLVQRFLFAPLGMRDSVWNRAVRAESGGLPDKSFAAGWEATLRDMARLGLLLLRGGTWNGERVLAEDWVYKITHPAFEDANTAYGYLTWLSAASNYTYPGFDEHNYKFQVPSPGSCSPFALWNEYPHGLSGSPDCNYRAPYPCTQRHDVGVWYAEGLHGQYIVGYRGLDLVLVAKNVAPLVEQRKLELRGESLLWEAVRPALVALDPTYRGDEDAFCAAYEHNDYAPDLR